VIEISMNCRVVSEVKNLIPMLTKFHLLTHLHHHVSYLHLGDEDDVSDLIQVGSL
jgi:hypothetical protein